jgi:hypothetical protein
MLDRFEVQVGGVTVIFTQVTAAVLFNFIRICRATRSHRLDPEI